MPVAPIFFRKKPGDHEEIAKNADASFGSRSVSRDRSDVAGSFTDSAKNVELDCRFQGEGPLVSLQVFEDNSGRQCAGWRTTGLHSPPPSTEPGKYTTCIRDAWFGPGMRLRLSLAPTRANPLERRCSHGRVYVSNGNNRRLQVL